MTDLDYATLPPSRFAVLDVVSISYEDDPAASTDLGTILEIRYYPTGGYRYGVSGELGGILDDAMLAPTGRRDSVTSFWNRPLRKGEVVRISDDYSKDKWRGFFGTVDSCYDDTDDYGIAIAVADHRAVSGTKIKYRDIETRHLISDGDRIPPQPVPRPTLTWRANGDKGFRPAHEFSIIDEIDQYL